MVLIPFSLLAVEFSNEAGKIVKRQAQGLLVEKCRFLETAGCARTCLHACKIPTQRFFLEEMGLPVTMLPNMTDFRCADSSEYVYGDITYSDSSEYVYGDITYSVLTTE